MLTLCFMDEYPVLRYQPYSVYSKVDELLYLYTSVDLNKDKRKRESQTEIQHYLKIDLDLGRILEKPSLAKPPERFPNA